MENYLNVFTRFVVLTIVLVLTSCGGGSSSSDSNDSQYTLQLTANQAVSLEKGARIKVTLSGFEQPLVDGFSTLISISELNIEQIPTVINLAWPKNAVEKIVPPVKNQANVRYILGFSIDVNGDDLICRGDYIQDFNISPFNTFDGMPSSPISIQVREVEGDFCTSF